MNITHVLKSPSIAPLAIALCLALAGSQGCSSTPAPLPQAKAISPAIQANAAAPAIAVVGNDSLADLGPVAPGSIHVVVFAVDNPSDQRLVFRSVRGDCDCVAAKGAPDSIAARGSARIAVTYLAPKAAMDHESRLMIATDSPIRRVISLRIKSQPLSR